MKHCNYFLLFIVLATSSLLYGRVSLNMYKTWLSNFDAAQKAGKFQGAYTSFVLLEGAYKYDSKQNIKDFNTELNSTLAKLMPFGTNFNQPYLNGLLRTLNFNTLAGQPLNASQLKLVEDGIKIISLKIRAPKALAEAGIESNSLIILRYVPKYIEESFEGIDELREFYADNEKEPLVLRIVKIYEQRLPLPLDLISTSLKGLLTRVKARIAAQLSIDENIEQVKQEIKQLYTQFMQHAKEENLEQALKTFIEALKIGTLYELYAKTNAKKISAEQLEQIEVADEQADELEKTVVSQLDALIIKTVFNPEKHTQYTANFARSKDAVDSFIKTKEYSAAAQGLLELLTNALLMSKGHESEADELQFLAEVKEYAIKLANQKTNDQVSLALAQEIVERIPAIEEKITAHWAAMPPEGM